MFIGGHYHCIYNYDDLLSALYHTYKNGGNTLQIFVGKNTSTTIKQKAIINDKEGHIIKKFLKNMNMKIFIHGSLSLNFANPLINKYKWSLDNLIFDINFAIKIGAKAIVIHLGSIFKDRYLLSKYDNKSINNEAYSNMIKSLEYVIKNIKNMKNIKILLETSAGQKNKIGTSLQDLGKLYNKIKPKFKKYIGFCIDTCHIFSAGYDLSTPHKWIEYIKLFNKYIGIKNIYLIHLNDSKKPFNSHTDYHTNLLKGYIFKNNIETLKTIVLWAFKNKIPIILETRNLNKYKKEIKLIYSFLPS
jgi:apurinic endonuclease APN1